MRITRLLFLLIAVFLIRSTAEAQFQVRVKFNEIPNLTYQLDCVGELPIYCSRQNLGDLWTREFLKTDEDRRMLKEWARLRDLYSKDVRLSEDSADSPSSIDLSDKIRIAGFQAASVEDYAARLDLLTAPSDRRAFERVVRHFAPRFRIWWRSEAAKAGDDFAKQTDVLLRAPKISEPLKQFYNFYQTDLPDAYEISFNLFYVPSAIKEPTNGQQLENYSLMEFRANEKPAQRVDVAVHELCHFFYDNRKTEVGARLEQRFYATRRAGALPAFNLLNEALAAAFGNGMIARAVTPPAEFEKYVAAKNSFYDNDSIDRAAKAILPLLDERLGRRQTIDDPEFVGDYISALEKAFGADLLKPKLYLSEMFLFVDGKYAASMRRDARRALEPASFYAVEADWNDDNILDDYHKRPRLNSVFIVHPDNLGELVKNKIVSESNARTMRKEFDVKQAVLFNAERAPFTYVYIIVAKDAEGARSALERLAGAQQFLGVYKF
jgi:hypothetical protein